jgi:hypothetical protein
LVDPLFEDAGALEVDYFSGFEGDMVSGPRISPLSGAFFPDAEFPEPTDQDVFTILKGFFGDLEKRFNRLGGTRFGQAGPAADTVY